MRGFVPFDHAVLGRETFGSPAAGGGLGGPRAPLLTRGFGPGVGLL